MTCGGVVVEAAACGCRIKVETRKERNSTAQLHRADGMWCDRRGMVVPDNGEVGVLLYPWAIPERRATFEIKFHGKSDTPVLPPSSYFSSFSPSPYFDDAVYK